MAHCGYSEVTSRRHTNVELTSTCGGFPSTHPDAGLNLVEMGRELLSQQPLQPDICQTDWNGPGTSLCAVEKIACVCVHEREYVHMCEYMWIILSVCVCVFVFSVCI